MITAVRGHCPTQAMRHATLLICKDLRPCVCGFPGHWSGACFEGHRSQIDDDSWLSKQKTSQQATLEGTCLPQRRCLLFLHHLLSSAQSDAHKLVYRVTASDFHISCLFSVLESMWWCFLFCQKISNLHYIIMYIDKWNIYNHYSSFYTQCCQFLYLFLLFTFRHQEQNSSIGLCHKTKATHADRYRLRVKDKVHDDLFFCYFSKCSENN